MKGIAKINAFYFIAYTANFTLFATARAYACYFGFAGKLPLLRHFAAEIGQVGADVLGRLALTGVRERGHGSLFINELATKKNTSVEYGVEAKIKLYSSRCLL